jgi:hypothetical protein
VETVYLRHSSFGSGASGYTSDVAGQRCQAGVVDREGLCEDRTCCVCPRLLATAQLLSHSVEALRCWGTGSSGSQRLGGVQGVEVEAASWLERWDSVVEEVGYLSYRPSGREGAAATWEAVEVPGRVETHSLVGFDTCWAVAAVDIGWTEEGQRQYERQGASRTRRRVTETGSH